jgi:hypothetical protein
MDRQTTSLRKLPLHLSSCGSMFAMAAVFALTLLAPRALQAQTFSVLHNFNDGPDGAAPFAGLTVGAGGVLYGTASGGGTYGGGTVFKLSQVGSAWVFSPLYEFGSRHGDGTTPYGGVVIGPNGALYGTASRGGDNYGTVFELRPPAAFCKSATCYWDETILYSFMGMPDGDSPLFENLAFDQAGNIYGTTADGGIYYDGTTFELTSSGGGYTESILHNFGSGTDGLNPEAGVVLDTAGNVYGTTLAGGTGGAGTVYQLTPSNGGWLENFLVNFDITNGSYPEGDLIMDASGNLYGTTTYGPPSGSGYGVVFKLAPSGGGFTYSLLYAFGLPCSPVGSVAMDAAGNFFGVCVEGGNGDDDGWIFELTNCSQECSLVYLHDFSGSDGAHPSGGPVLDANGNLYGTTTSGGTGNCHDGEGCGVVWEIAGVGARH